MRLHLFGAVCLLLGALGCAALAIPEEPVMPGPLRPVWSSTEFASHLRFLNSPETGGRGTATAGFGRAAAYVAARLREFRLHPVIGNDFRVIYGTSINHPLSATLRSVGVADSLVYLPGVDYMAHGRTDSGFVALSDFLVVGDTPVDPLTHPSTRAEPGTSRDGFGVISRTAGAAELETWRDTGASLVIIVGELETRMQPAPIAGLLVFRMTPRSAALLLETDEIERFFARFDGRTVTLRRRVVARVHTNFQAWAGAMNIMAYVPGKHPRHAAELVIVCTDLDGAGTLAGVTTFEFDDFAVPTAATMEVARNLGYVSRLWPTPERSVMFAAWSGSRLGEAGLQSFLESPPWPLSNVVSVIYVGLDADREPAVRELLQRHGLPLHVVPPHAEPLHEPSRLIVPEPLIRRAAQQQYPDLPPADVPSLSAIIPEAVDHARALAEQTYQITMIRATVLDANP